MSLYRFKMGVLEFSDLGSGLCISRFGFKMSLVSYNTLQYQQLSAARRALRNSKSNTINIKSESESYVRTHR